MKLETITEKIFAKSDAELKAEIERATTPIASLFYNGDKSLYGIIYRELDSEKQVNGFDLLSRMRADAFEGLRDRRRQSAVKEFMDRFEEFSAEIDFLKDTQRTSE